MAVSITCCAALQQRDRNAMVGGMYNRWVSLWRICGKASRKNQPAHRPKTAPAPSRRGQIPFDPQYRAPAGGRSGARWRRGGRGWSDNIRVGSLDAGESALPWRCHADRLSPERPFSGVRSWFSLPHRSARPRGPVGAMPVLRTGALHHRVSGRARLARRHRKSAPRGRR